MQEINSFLTAFATLNAGYGVSNDYDFSAIGVCDLNEIKSVTQRHLKLEKHDSIHIFNWKIGRNSYLLKMHFSRCVLTVKISGLELCLKNIMLNGLSPKQYFYPFITSFLQS